MPDFLNWLELQEGSLPLIVSLPHTGTEVPGDCASCFAPGADYIKDTDWHIEKLYRPIVPVDATWIRTRISRSVIDVNRPSDGQSLYPGQATTDLCPATDFDGVPLYTAGAEPDADEIARRLSLYHRPYHKAIERQIARLRKQHATVVILDCHSIRPRVPRLFEGTLPTLNIGTNGGSACDARLLAAVCDAAGQSPFSWVANGRFRGGWITRHFGSPSDGVHVVQIELAMHAYLQVAHDEGYARPEYNPAVARLVQDTLGEIVQRLAAAKF
jgi:N-formylglutamate deformylase